MKHLEYEEQKAFFEYVRIKEKKYPFLKYMHSSQSGEFFNNFLRAVRAKKTGLKAGVPDIFLPYRSRGYSGLFIELKASKKCKPSKNQEDFIRFLNEQDFLACICYGAKEAINLLNFYIEND